MSKGPVISAQYVQLIFFFLFFFLLKYGETFLIAKSNDIKLLGSFIIIISFSSRTISSDLIP